MPHIGRWWIDRIGHAIPDLNDRVLNLDILYQYCEAKEYRATERPLRRLHGCSFLSNTGRPSMVINSLLGEQERLVAGWHEFIHLFSHSPKDNVFCSTGNLWRHTRTEAEAQTVGVLALLPRKMMYEDLSHYPQRIIKYRRQVWDEYGL